MLDIETLKFPIGKFRPLETYSSNDISSFINRIASLPGKLLDVTHNFTQQQFDTPYREGGWTVRQLVHHIADSHMNAYIRFKWTLTENTPTIKAYDEKLWANTSEVSADPQLSLALLASLHPKWVALLKSMASEDFKKAFVHPQSGKMITLERMADLYAWHGEHHAAHITALAARMNWA